MKDIIRKKNRPMPKRLSNWNPYGMTIESQLTLIASFASKEPAKKPTKAQPVTRSQAQPVKQVQSKVLSFGERFRIAHGYRVKGKLLADFRGNILSSESYIF